MHKWHYPSTFTSLLERISYWVQCRVKAYLEIEGGGGWGFAEIHIDTNFHVGAMHGVVENAGSVFVAAGWAFPCIVHEIVNCFGAT